MHVRINCLLPSLAGCLMHATLPCPHWLLQHYCAPLSHCECLLCFSRYFGCGLPFPTKLGGCRVLDLGSGSGRDCFAFSKLVGESGHVTGIDMTEELVMRETCPHSVGIVDCGYPVCQLNSLLFQVAVSREYAEYHQKTFGYKEANVSFVQGYMEKLNEAGVQDNTIDAVM